jgi:hypothetical protein
MAHKKFYYVLCALVVVIVFGTAAICNMCGTSATTTDKIGTDKDTAAASTSKPGSSATANGGKDSATESTDKTSDTESSESSSDSESTTSEGTVPTIKLEIYEGPTYSAGDDICYYRIKATVTGSPAPTVKFSKDDSSGAWGSKKVQVNIHRGQPYTLTATAKNSAGEANASIKLTWGCGEENRNPVINDIAFSPSGSIKTGQPYTVTADASDPDGNVLAYKWTVGGGTITSADTVNPMNWTSPAAVGSCTVTLKVTDGKGGEATSTKTINIESAIVSFTVPKITSEGGYIDSSGTVYAGGDIFAGDSVTNKIVRGHISFDISSLAGKTIDSASMPFNLKQTWGNSSVFGTLFITVADWGAEPLVPADYNVGGLAIQSFSNVGGGSFTCNAAGLKTELQNAINAGKSRFQIRILWDHEVTDGNSGWDGWEYDKSNGVILNITYH